MEELYSCKRGSVTRRHFLNVTGLGAASVVTGAAVPGLLPRRAFAAGDIGDRVVLATWPNHHDPANFEAFTEATGAHVQVNVFGSNEEMLAKLQAGASCWDVFVPTNYTLTTYVSEDIIEPLDTAKLPHYDASAYNPRFAEAGSVNGLDRRWQTAQHRHPRDNLCAGCRRRRIVERLLRNSKKRATSRRCLCADRLLLTPEVNAPEVLAHGYPTADANTNALLPAELLNDPILYPAEELLSTLEFGAAVTLTDPNRADLMARFKSA